MISIIIPCYDEELVVEHCYEELCKALKVYDSWEIILISDGSNDSTWDKIKALANIDERVIDAGYETNGGYGKAIRTGLKKAKGDYIITFDADLAISPELAIPVCLAYLKEYDMVIGSRYRGIEPDYPLFRRLASWGYRTLNKLLFRWKINDTQSGVIAFKKEILKDIIPTSDGYEASMELVLMAFKRGYSIVEAPIKFEHKTESGETPVLKSAPKMFKNSLRLWRGLYVK